MYLQDVSKNLLKEWYGADFSEDLFNLLDKQYEHLPDGVDLLLTCLTYYEQELDYRDSQILMFNDYLTVLGMAKDYDFKLAEETCIYIYTILATHNSGYNQFYAEVLDKALKYCIPF